MRRVSGMAAALLLAMLPGPAVAAPAWSSPTYGFGVAYPAQSPIAHEFQADNRSGYAVRASIHYGVTFTALLGGTWLGPYPMGSVTLPAIALDYPVRQAQPELVAIGE